MADDKYDPWQNAAKRTVLGEKKELASLPGFWIRPRKYSIAGIDAIRSEAIKKRNAMNSSTLKAVIKKARDENIPFDQLKDKLSGDELAELVVGTDEDIIAVSPSIRLKLRYGIGAHNFDGDDKEYLGTRQVSNDFIDKIMDCAELTMEIVSAIEEWNSPLAPGTSGSSGTSPSPSITESGTRKKPKTSPTE